MLVSRRRRRRSDQGFTVTETVVAACLGMVVATALMGMMVSGTNAEHDLTGVAASQEQLRRGLVEVLQDIRAAEPLGFVATDPTPPAAGTVELRVQRWEPGASEPTLVRWHVATGPSGAAELVRDVVEVDSAGQITSEVATYRLPGVGDDTVVEFLDDDGDAIPATDQQRISDCAATVRITLEAAAEGGDHPAAVESEAQLRNQAATMPWCA